jgi:hypothetical protein
VRQCAAGREKPRLNGSRNPPLSNSEWGRRLRTRRARTLLGWVEMANPVVQTASQTVESSQRVQTPPLHGLHDVFKHVMEEHGDAFALVKQLSMRPDERARSEATRRASVKPLPHELGEMAEACAALSEIVQSQVLSVGNDAEPSDLADALAALDALNPGSPESGPVFLHVSELVEAHINQNDPSPKSNDGSPLQAAC